MKKITALVDRFGSNRMNAEKPAEFLRGCTCVNVPFAGGMCEVAWFTANIINVNDLDSHVINLAENVRDNRAELVRQAEATPFHPKSLAAAQEICQRKRDSERPCLEWATAYFLASWMTRGGKMGTKGEFEQGLSVRWKSGGGDSVVRFRSATEALAEWEKVMRRCTFHTLDAFDFLAECKARDVKENGIYCDPPWVDDGDGYNHNFGEVVNFSADLDDKFTPIERISKHELLVRVLESFQNARIVVRYGDHPLIRKLYRESQWTWHRLTSRTQANDDKAEVLLVKK